MRPEDEQEHPSESQERQPLMAIRTAMRAARRRAIEVDAQFERGSPAWREAHWRLEQAPDETAGLQQAARSDFARRNGWTNTQQIIELRDIGHRQRVGMRNGWRTPETGTGPGFSTWWPFLDHQHAYRACGRYVALIGEPYQEEGDEVALEQLRVWLNSMRLDLFVAPDPLASIWYPGSTRFLVIAALGTEIRWLPEQDGRLKPLWRRANAAGDREDGMEQRANEGAS